MGQCSGMRGEFLACPRVTLRVSRSNFKEVKDPPEGSRSYSRTQRSIFSDPQKGFAQLFRAFSIEIICIIIQTENSNYAEGILTETSLCTIYHVQFTICDRLRHVPFTMYNLQFVTGGKKVGGEEIRRLREAPEHR